jgi:hypothetical protein
MPKIYYDLPDDIERKVRVEMQLTGESKRQVVLRNLRMIYDTEGLSIESQYKIAINALRKTLIRLKEIE